MKCSFVFLMLSLASCTAKVPSAPGNVQCEGEVGEAVSEAFQDWDYSDISQVSVVCSERMEDPCGKHAIACYRYHTIYVRTERLTHRVKQDCFGDWEDVTKNIIYHELGHIHGLPHGTGVMEPMVDRCKFIGVDDTYVAAVTTNRVGTVAFYEPITQ